MGGAHDDLENIGDQLLDDSSRRDVSKHRATSLVVSANQLAVAREALGVDLSAVILVCLVNFVDSLGGSISTPILPFYARSFHVSYAQVGTLFSAFAMAQALAMPALSLGSDRYGRRAMLLISIVGTVLGAVWQGTATGFYSLLVARVFSGIWAGVGSVCQVYIVDVVPPEHRARYMSYLLSSTQASVLFGPSLGAGLSVLGLQVPILTQAAVSFVLFFVVYAHLPESPEWCQAHCAKQNKSVNWSSPPSSPRADMANIASREAKRTKAGIGNRTTFVIIAVFGAMSFCSMVTQMMMLSMFAVFAEDTFNLDSVHTGFTMTLGAIASVGTNIWITPAALPRLGEFWSTSIGFMLMVVGSAGTTMKPIGVSIACFMIAYQGLAINSSAVATAAANLTDWTNRSTVMTGVRMLKAFGAVLGPVLAGHLAASDVRLPFIGAACSAFLGLLIHVATSPAIIHVHDLLEKRKTVGAATALLDGSWQDEYGTPEEILDLGNYVAQLLTTRHYRWVTYNEALKNYLSDAFPEVPTDSEEAHRSAYDRRRKIVREQTLAEAKLSYQELERQLEEAQDQLEIMQQMMMDMPRLKSGSLSLEENDPPEKLGQTWARQEMIMQAVGGQSY